MGSDLSLSPVSTCFNEQDNIKSDFDDVIARYFNDEWEFTAGAPCAGCGELLAGT